ncbi:MAG: restriction endonuclease subunit S, partial [Oceanipulchritudo sp.]
PTHPMPKPTAKLSRKTKHTPAGEIPADWGCVKLGALLTIKHGFAFDSKNFSSVGDYILLTPGSFYEVGGYRDQKNKTKFYTGKVPEEYVLKQNDLLVAMTEQAEGLLGSALRVPLSGKFLHNQRLGLVETNNKNAVDLDFVYWIYNNPKSRRQISRTASGTKVHHTSPSKLLDFFVALPPLSEQRKIASILSTWDTALEKLDALIRAKQQQKKALMQQLLSGRMRLPGFDKSKGERVPDRFNQYPKDWTHLRLGSVTRESTKRNSGNEGLPVLSCTKHRGLVLSEEYFGKKIYADNLSDYKVVKREQFAYATNHIEEGSIGLLDFCEAGLVSPIYTVFSVKDGVQSKYLFRLLKSPLLIHLYRINTSASVDRRGSLKYKEFANIKVWLPSIAEQIEINRILENCDREIHLLTQQRESIDLQKRGLMQRLLTGRVRVNNHTSNS